MNTAPAPPSCPRCDYPTTGLATSQCPECGNRLEGATFEPAARWSIAWTIALLVGMGALPSVAVLFAEPRSTWRIGLIGVAMTLGIIGFARLFWRWGTLFAIGCGVLAGFVGTVISFALGLLLLVIGMGHH